jgi:hypothetical protein
LMAQDYLFPLKIQREEKVRYKRLQASNYSPGNITLRINSGASWTHFCVVCFAKNRPACGVRFDAFVIFPTTYVPTRQEVDDRVRLGT